MLGWMLARTETSKKEVDMSENLNSKEVRHLCVRQFFLFSIQPSLNQQAQLVSWLKCFDLRTTVTHIKRIENESFNLLQPRIRSALIRLSREQKKDPWHVKDADSAKASFCLYVNEAKDRRPANRTRLNLPNTPTTKLTCSPKLWGRPGIGGSLVPPSGPPPKTNKQ